MWQPTQYYHTKMQLAKMELEGKMLAGKYPKQKRNAGSGPILEKMRMLELMDEQEETENSEQESMLSLQPEEQKPEIEIQQTEIQQAEIQEEVHTEKKRKKKKSGKHKKEEQVADETNEKQAAEEKEEQAIVLDVKHTGIQMPSREQMQDRMVWAEILGEPVSVKRRKKRVEQIYGNQGHAYRR